MEMWPLPWYLFFLKKQNKFKKHETQNAEILRNIARLTLTNITVKIAFLESDLKEFRPNQTQSVSFKERVKRWFFVTFDIIISHIFHENFI